MSTQALAYHCFGNKYPRKFLLTSEENNGSLLDTKAKDGDVIDACIWQFLCSAERARDTL